MDFWKESRSPQYITSKNPDAGIPLILLAGSSHHTSPRKQRNPTGVRQITPGAQAPAAFVSNPKIPPRGHLYDAFRIRSAYLASRQLAEVALCAAPLLLLVARTALWIVNHRGPHTAKPIFLPEYRRRYREAMVRAALEALSSCGKAQLGVEALHFLLLLEGFLV